MREIHEKDFESYTISNGWNLTVYSLKNALREWGNMKSGTLYGNKPDGSRAILDTKTAL